MKRAPDNDDDDDDDVEKDEEETGIGVVTAPLGPLDTTLQWEKKRERSSWPHIKCIVCLKSEKVPSDMLCELR